MRKSSLKNFVWIGLLIIASSIVGCENFGPSEEPLPTFDDLREDFADQQRGYGLVCENDAPCTEVSATYHTSRNGTLVSFRVMLRELEGTGGVAMFLDGVEANDLEAGMEFDSLQFINGHGRLAITSVNDETISGVFAGDISSSTVLDPTHRRIEGGFNAIRDSLIN